MIKNFIYFNFIYTTSDMHLRTYFNEENETNDTTDERMADLAGI